VFEILVKRSLGRTMSRWKDNIITTDVIVIAWECVWTELIWLRLL
jgi:hypothetical protein